jgi:hypothetical protein
MSVSPMKITKMKQLDTAEQCNETDFVVMPHRSVCKDFSALSFDDDRVTGEDYLIIVGIFVILLRIALLI